MKSTDGIVRVGGVGTGRIFQHAHLTPYPRLWSKARLVGFYDQNPQRAREACDAYAARLEAYAVAHPETEAAVRANLGELRCHDSLDGLLAQVDVVDVCTHSRGRMSTAIAALEAGVHAMVEKPMARTWIEADRAARAFAARPEIYCQLNDDNVFDPRYRHMHDLLVANSIGRPQSMWLIRGSSLSSTSVLKSQANALENGGGCLMDYGSHGLAAAWYVLGTHYRPIRIEAVKIRVRFPDRVLEGEPYRMCVDDDAHIKVLMEDPVSGSWATIFLEATWTGGEIGLSASKNGGQNAGYVRIEGDEGVLNTVDGPRITITRWDGARPCSRTWSFRVRRSRSIMRSKILSTVSGPRHRPPAMCISVRM